MERYVKWDLHGEIYGEGISTNEENIDDHMHSTDDHIGGHMISLLQDVNAGYQPFNPEKTTHDPIWVSEIDEVYQRMLLFLLKRVQDKDGNYINDAAQEYGGNLLKEAIKGNTKSTTNQGSSHAETAFKIKKHVEMTF
ncbi:hypothetical protein ACFE04_002617 [Oxalis oulophora]